MKLNKTLFILLVQMVAIGVFAQGTLTLIGPSVRNGSFEAVTVLPWLGDIVAAQNATFASDGEWFGIASGLANGTQVRALTRQTIPVSPSDGHAFLLSFDARVADSGFDSLSIFLDGGGVGAARTVLESPPLNSTAWETHQVLFVFPEAWEASMAQLSLLFFKDGAVVGMTYTGYLDNIVLQQIPEPSVFALIVLGSGVLLCRRHAVR